MKTENVFALVALAAVGAIALMCFWSRSVSLPRETEALIGGSVTLASSTKSIVIPKKTYDELAVPYMSEAPRGVWSGPWKNACEEVSIFMVDRFYKGQSTATTTDAENYMNMLFHEEDLKYGSNINSDSVRMAFLIDNYADFGEKIVKNPSVLDIKNEIESGHPVITLHSGFDLHNSHIPFLATGSAYHVMVIRGYDEKTKEFIVNDPGDSVDGADHRYSYLTFMKSLHDFDYTTGKADGAATVIFTFAK